MPGYNLTPVEDFARLQSLRCPSCSFLLREALQTEQGIRLCKTCYDNIQSSPGHTCLISGLKLEPNEPFHPDVAVRREIKKLVVLCANHELGCTWTGTVQLHEETHNNECLVPCNNKGCAMTVPRVVLEEHMASECEFRAVTCEDCGVELQYSQLESHTERCPKRVVSCPNCDQQVLSMELDDHIIHKCNICICVVCNKKINKHEDEEDEEDNLFNHLKEPIKVFEHSQQQGLRLQAHDKDLTKAEKRLDAMESEIQEGRAAILQQREDTDKLIQALQDRVKELEKAKSISDSLIQDLMSKIDRQDQLLLRQKQQPSGGYYPNEGAYSGLAEPPGEKLIEMERKIEDVERQTAVVKVNVSELELQLQASLASTYNGAFLWRIPDVKKRKRDAIENKVTSIYSPPFYTGRNGYKICIRAYLNGDGIGFGTHLSIFFVLMRGEYDPLLKWPFDCKVSLILVDQESRRHIVQTFKPSSSSSSFKQPVQDMNIASGCPKFSDLNVLDNPSYIKDDVMYIKCIVDTSRIFHP